MNIDQFTDKFLELEYKKKMFSLIYSGINLWEYMRFTCYTDVRELLFGIHEPWNPNIIPEYDGPWSLKKIIRKYIKENYFFAQSRDVLIFSHARKIKQKNGHYRDVYTYWIDKELELSHYVVDRNFYDGSYYEQDSNNILIDDLSRFGRLKGWKKVYPYSNKEVRSICDNIIVNNIEHEFCLELPNSIKKKWIDHIVFCLSEKGKAESYFEYLIDKIKPRIVILVTSYDYYMKNLIEISKKRGIPTVELQHGRIGRNHISYNFFEGVNPKSFPDYVFCFGQYDKNTVRWPFADNQIMTTGFAELEMFKAVESREDDARRVILIIGGTDDMLRFAMKLQHAIDGEKYKMIYKCHPSEYGEWEKTIMPYLDEQLVEIVHSNELSIYHYISNSEWVVGDSSTVMFEATYFDVKVGILNSDISAAMCSAIYESGRGIKINDVDHLMKLLDEDDIHYNMSNQKNRYYFFENDSINKMKQSIKRIILNSQ